MKSLKNHIFLIFGLISILFSIEAYFVFNKIVNTYENKILKDSYIVVVSTKKLDNIHIKDIKTISSISVEKSLKNLEVQLQNFDINKVKKMLPYFYKLYFKKLPTPDELNSIENKLLEKSYIKRVESFRSTQSYTYNLLLIIKLMITIFMYIISFIAFLLILKQLEVWRFEHSERMYIMELFGAPVLLRSAPLLKPVLIDSIFSVVIMYVILKFIFSSNMYLNLLLQLQIKIDINLWLDLLLFFGISLGITLISTIIVILSKKDESL